MTLAIMLLAVLVALISWGKVNAFLAFLLISLPVGFALGLGPAQVSMARFYAFLIQK